jgi:hypothetical protein
VRRGRLGPGEDWSRRRRHVLPMNRHRLWLPLTGIVLIAGLAVIFVQQTGRQGPPPSVATAEVEVRRWVQGALIANGITPQPRDKITVRRVTYKDGQAAVHRTHGESPSSRFIKTGEVSALARDGDCWEARLSTGLRGDHVAYFDDDGRLVLLWLIPEG